MSFDEVLAGILNEAPHHREQHDWLAVNGEVVVEAALEAYAQYGRGMVIVNLVRGSWSGKGTTALSYEADERYHHEWSEGMTARVATYDPATSCVVRFERPDGLATVHVLCFGPPLLCSAWHPGVAGRLVSQN